MTTSTEASAPARSAFARPVKGLAYARLVVAAVVVPLARRVWALAAPVVLSVSGTGWIVLALGVACIGVSTTLGWREYFYLGATLIAAIAIAIPFALGRSTYSVDVHLTPPRVVVGERAHGSLVVTNVGPKPLLTTRMELPVGQALAEFSIPGLAPSEDHEDTFTVSTARRAVIVAGPAVSVRGDQLGLLRRMVKWTGLVELFVHPLTTRLATSAAGLIHDLEGQASKTITDNDISFHALRPYVPGDDRRNVHWRTSARTGKLMIRQFEETRRSQLTMLHSCFRDYYSSEDEFELAVSVVGSIASQVIRDGTQMSIVTENRLLRTHSVTAMLDDTCRLDLLPKKFGSAREFGRTRTLRLPSPSIVMIVAGSQMSKPDYRSIATLFGPETKVIAFQVELGSKPRLSYLSGVSVMTVGQLSDLPKLFARAAA